MIVYSDCDELKDDYNLLLFFIFISLSVYCMVFNWKALWSAVLFLKCSINTVGLDNLMAGSHQQSALGRTVETTVRSTPEFTGPW